MDSQPHLNGSFSLQSTFPGTPQYPGAFLPGAQQTTIHGGSFASNVHIHRCLPSPEDDYRRIPRGDIRLLREIRLDEADVVQCSKRRNFARRMLAAKVHPMESERAVILYDGKNAEEERRKYVERHSKFWHPNLLQIFGLANYSGVRAVVTHEDLMPYREFLALHRPSPVMTVYLIACWRLDLISLYAFGQRDPAYSSSKPNIFSDMIDDGTQWIRRSTGCLCVEFEPSGIDAPPGTLYQPDLPVDAPLVLNNPDFETHAVQILTEDVYQGICRYSLANSHELGLFKQAEVRVGVLAFLPLGVQHKVPGHIVASPSVLDKSVDLYNQGSWNCYSPFLRLASVNFSGWTRFNIWHWTVAANVSLNIWLKDYWLPQANHIFQQMQVTSNHDKYVFVHSICFCLSISKARGSGGPRGYLFVCPPDHLRTGPDSFAWPQCPWFWSMDPNGDQPLTEKDALRLGFPGVQMEIEVSGRSWPSSVYEGLKKFHAAKGFDPESQELAQQLELPLLEVSDQGSPLFSNVSDGPQIFIPECLDPVGKQARQVARAERVLELAEWKKANHQIEERNMDKKCRFEADSVAWQERGNGPRQELARPRWKDYRPEIKSRRPIKMLNHEDQWEQREEEDGGEEEGEGSGRQQRRRTRHRGASPY
ncbi:hypothetical protein FB45DRAFT_921030 [Roridomyces roridus]|uniref:Uncharacterized protein n=1 Tax=Roridomyces roridus TaxID=1738132 RepID=A0AAD7BQ69_9AGAR|nr:hypothetical protein FB45DRAFT_921030 [Roridomyces roridus]